MNEGRSGTAAGNIYNTVISVLTGPYTEPVRRVSEVETRRFQEEKDESDRCNG
jgi:hypothetical protein